MTFNTLQFAAFAVIILSVYYLLQLRSLFRIQNYFLIVASYVFYSAWDWRFTGLLLWITVLDYCCAIAIHGSTGGRRKLFLLISVMSDLGLLGIFKYLGFFETSFIHLAAAVGLTPSWPLVSLILPIGISFVVFESMSYTIDVYRGELQPDFRFSSYALFVAFFPKLVAGPIIRAKTLLHQIEHPRVIGRDGVERALWWLLAGYFLKLVVADNLSALVDRVFSPAGPASGGDALLGVYAFAFQIFGDFAGYSSIAIGIAALLGFSLPRNFRQPYLVTNPQEFWRHWHISLSTWLRDYLYVSLGGSRVGEAKLYRNLLLTMTLGGLWHGASWTYVIWGIYHGLLLTAHRTMTSHWRPPQPAASAAASSSGLLMTVGMFHLTCLGWLLFRARSIAQVQAFLARIATGLSVSAGLGRELLVKVAVAGILVFGYQILQRAYGEDFPVDRMTVSSRALAFTACYFVIIVAGEFGIKNFISSNFEV